MDRKALIDVAAGRVKADVVFKNGRIIQVLTGEILTGETVSSPPLENTTVKK